MDNKYNYFNVNNKIYMVTMALLIYIIFYYGHFQVGMVALGLYAVLVVYNIYNSKIKKGEWKKFIENFSSKLDIATTSTLVKLPFPLIIIGYLGNILWYNQSVTTMLEGEDLLNKNIRDIIKELNLKQVLEGKKNIFPNIKIKDSVYEIYTNSVDTNENKNVKDKIMLLYFYDTTEKNNIIKGINGNRESVMLVEVDNLDDVVKNTEEDKAPLLVADIERMINSYGQSVNAVVKKYTSNKYVIIVQDKYIEKEIEMKFDILDSVREISNGNKLAVTLSIGVGRGEDTPLKNYEFATSAKELALGRGGDQVVVKKGDKLSFFGGKTKEVEKRTKVRARVIAHALMDLVSESNAIFIMGHKNPDPDCLGAAIGLYSIIKRLDKECYIILEGVSSGIKSMMDIILEDEEYKNTFITSEKFKSVKKLNSLLILVDVHNESHVLNLDIVNEVEKVVIIDHHRKSQDFIQGAVLSYMETYASSTAELVTEMIQYMVDKPKLKHIEAVSLLAGICVDTKNFSFKTGVRTFEAAAFLRRHGADTMDVKKMFSDNMGVFLQRADIIRAAKIKNGIAVAICPTEIEDSVIAAQAADELLNITGIQASFVIVKIGDEVYISGRSLGKINVQLILETLGGGGHMTMAGTKFTSMKLEEVVEKLNEAIDEYLKEDEK
ncbi:DHH family phosphoesterase [Clostridium lacusfryxellense]|uniref:DHH family phosphoesterase n=1 Tax=Clostridium lacusfryxellense TaxID=205328 RepID=UPI001C0E671A|nr:DHH family phosphoesterase [Clostridium lacusfryxellense]MBU3110509.1 DHH family phosphoesterase [Clostridium lacusfryxellense]